MAPEEYLDEELHNCKHSAIVTSLGVRLRLNKNIRLKIKGLADIRFLMTFG